MVKVRARGEKIRRFLINNVEAHPADIARVTAEKFGVSRQAVNRHLHLLVEEGALTCEGNTRARTYALAPLEAWSKSYTVSDALQEDRPWLEDVAPALSGLPANVVHVWHYGFSEMFNNAIDHSEGTRIIISIEKTAATTRILIKDDGVGIFKKIQRALDLIDERQAPLELAKGKFTTDPSRHSGEGIFFTSRMFDEFRILSGNVYFSHDHGEASDWIMGCDTSHGTLVALSLSNHTSRTTTKVFDKFSSGDEYGFTNTVVPVKMVEYGDDNLVSRSQAKRMLARLERFRTVVLDFQGVETIGQAFADEVFRVFQNVHPEVALVPISMNTQVKKMVLRARVHGSP